MGRGDGPAPPRYLAGRRQGPLFVTTGLPNIVPAELDRSPDGRGRLSYQRAWSLFREASGGQWTLHQLRHSALTHLGEDGVSALLLMAKSRHRDLRTLSRYVRPGTQAVAQLTAEHDPARRGKHPRVAPTFVLKYNIRTRSLADQRDRGRTGRRG